MFTSSNAADGGKRAGAAHEGVAARRSDPTREDVFTRSPDPTREASVLWRSARRYAVATVLYAAFSAIYESFSHGVWSAYMVCLCLYPLILGAIPAVIGDLLRMRVPRAARQAWACGVTTLAMGSCLNGVVEIYGTTSPLLVPYLPMGLALLALGIVLARLRAN